MSVTDMFGNIQGFLSADQDVREDIRKVVQVLEQTAREILTVLQSVHQPSGFKDIPSKCLRARELFCTVRNHIGDLKTKFPADQYYRFHEHWRFVLQRVTFLAAFVFYLEGESLVTRDEVAEILGIEVDREKGFHLDIEDYLAGVLIMASELSRLAVNSVTARGLLPPPAHLHLHQRAGLGLPPAQPQERPAAQALRRTQVRRQEDRGGGLRPVDPRPGQGAGKQRRRVELGVGGRGRVGGVVGGRTILQPGHFHQAGTVETDLLPGKPCLTRGCGLRFVGGLRGNYG
ncbi:hypothetical protein AAFF_G00134170 [Aldrovandia affinis]|uniref:Translin n=1 Tax=Aldrovandia affinis TaxID=143900 RepID=A0AAD7W8Y6_9TELE|nr:hypothetical protein AAFF_G00134170 [Aldrovandia affinis]